MDILCRKKIIVFILPILLAELSVAAAHADEPGCSQSTVDSGYSPPATAYYLYPRQTVLPFYQWENNNGYCRTLARKPMGIDGQTRRPTTILS